MFEAQLNYIIQLCKNKKKKNPEEEQDPQKHIIKFKIVDEKNNPLENIALLITLPDGRIEEKSTDKNGMIEINNVQPGNCKLESDWRMAKVDDAVFIMD